MRKRLALIVALPLIVVCSAGLITFMGAQENPGVPALSHAPSVGGADASLTATADAARGHVGPAEPLPAEIEYYPDRIYRGNLSAMYRVSRLTGILASTDGGQTWAAKNTGLPGRTVYPFTADFPPLVTSFCIDPLNELRIALTLPESLYASEDGGNTWAKVEVKEPLKPNDQLTAVALNPKDPNSLLIGTSFHGFFETANRGKTWTDLSEKLGIMYLGGGSSEETASLAYVPQDTSRIVFCLGFGKGLYVVQRGAKTAVPIGFPGDQSLAPIVDIAFRGPDASGTWALEARTDNARWSLPLGSAGAAIPDAKAAPPGEWDLVELIGVQPPVDPVRAARTAKAAGKYGIYLSSFHAKGKVLDEHIAFCKANGLNSIVVDFKDDFGMVTYDTALEAPKKIGAVEKRFEAAELVRKAHENGLYLIGRIVVFRDKTLYNSNGYAYALWDRLSNKPWRYMKTSTDPVTGAESQYQGEYWVDPYSTAVWKYNTDIAREMESRGVDEIQFDYIRFPSDGELSRISYRFKKPGMGKVEALESFLAMARESISIPIGTDVYGYCGWARISGWVAQNIEVFSRYVDVISPMYYPSHFPVDFLGTMQYIPRAGYIYREGGDRAARIVEGRCLIRPYVQAFRIGGELKFSPAVYTNYLVSQIQGSLQSASSGFTLWNASNDYYMVTVPLSQYLPATAAADAVGQGAPPAVSGQGG
jgi:hypothetical protein